MNSLKYYDTASCMQVIGDVFINPNLLDLEEKYKFHEEDFPQEFHKILFGSIYNLHKLGLYNHRHLLSFYISLKKE